ncbi:MAG: VOC family protein [Acidimicrobiia bacterium]
MTGWAVIPTIRVRDMGEALDFYQNQLGFELTRGGPDEQNSSLSREDARIMIEIPTNLYSPEYNAAIVSRLDSASAIALYMKAVDLEELYSRLGEAGVKIVDPLADRPWGQAEFTIEDLQGNWLTFWKATEQSE